MISSMSDSSAGLINYVVRMVTPMKREFGYTLDVPQFLHSRPYAIDVIKLALQSQDLRLRDCATYLEGKMFGPRNSVPETLVPASAALAAVTEPQTSSHPSEAQLRAKILDKYKTGLR